jgi:hypothetical protein
MAEIPDRAPARGVRRRARRPGRALEIAAALRASELCGLGDQAQVRVLARGCRFWGGFATAGQ